VLDSKASTGLLGSTLLARQCHHGDEDRLARPHELAEAPGGPSPLAGGPRLDPERIFATECGQTDAKEST